MLCHSHRCIPKHRQSTDNMNNHEFFGPDSLVSRPITSHGVCFIKSEIHTLYFGLLQTAPYALTESASEHQNDSSRPIQLKVKHQCGNMSEGKAQAAGDRCELMNGRDFLTVSSELNRVHKQTQIVRMKNWLAEGKTDPCEQLHGESSSVS